METSSFSQKGILQCIVEAGVDWLPRVWDQMVMRNSSPHCGLGAEGSPHDLALHIVSSHGSVDTQTGLFVCTVTASQILSLFSLSQPGFCFLHLHHHGDCGQSSRSPLLPNTGAHDFLCLTLCKHSLGLNTCTSRSVLCWLL